MLYLRYKTLGKAWRMGATIATKIRNIKDKKKKKKKEKKRRWKPDHVNIF